MLSHEGDRQFFHYRGDFSGDVIVVEKSTGEETCIPARDLLDLAVGYIQQERQSRMEQMSREELIGQLTKPF